MTTPISTAARRICRDINTTPKELTRYYDEDGAYVAGHETGMYYSDPADIPVAAVQAAGRRNSIDGRMTEREAQDLLDAYAATGFNHGPEWQQWLHDLEFRRERENGAFDA